jgi:cysteine desulfurase / selenocysteine lyase
MIRVSDLAAAYAEEFPVKAAHIFFNHAGVCPLPLRSARAAQAVLEQQLRHGATDYSQWSRGVHDARRNLAALVRADASEIAFVKNTTHGLLIAAACIPWHEGDNVVTSAIEFPANVYPWLALERKGVETRFVGAREGRVLMDDLVAAMDSRTRAVALSWVQFSSGFRVDLGRLSELCRDRGAYLVVDGIQGLGALQLDLSRYAIDFLSADGHKWLLSVEGAGMLYVRRQTLDGLLPAYQGWLGMDDPFNFLDYHFRPRPDALRFEEGSRNVAGIHALGASVGLFLEAGPGRVEEAVLALTDSLAECLVALGCEITSPRRAEEKSGILTFRHPSVSSADIVAGLTQRGVVSVERAGSVRFSPHFYNDAEEVERALANLRETLAQA